MALGNLARLVFWSILSFNVVTSYMDDPKGREEQRARDAKIYLASRTHRCYSFVVPNKRKIFQLSTSVENVYYLSSNEWTSTNFTINSASKSSLFDGWYDGSYGTLACTTYTVWSVNDGAVNISQKPTTCRGEFPGVFWQSQLCTNLKFCWQPTKKF